MYVCITLPFVGTKRHMSHYKWETSLEGHTGNLTLVVPQKRNWVAGGWGWEGGFSQTPFYTF